jgi:hypothetical protein
MTYYDLINMLLYAEAHIELLMQNYVKRPIDVATVPEPHANF